MTKRKIDANQRWLAANATPEEFNAAFKQYCDSMWGLPTFAELRLIVETRRRLAAKSAA